jgi:hypothetical protein
MPQPIYPAWQLSQGNLPLISRSGGRLAIMPTLALVFGFAVLLCGFILFKISIIVSLMLLIFSAPFLLYAVSELTFKEEVSITKEWVNYKLRRLYRRVSWKEPLSNYHGVHVLREHSGDELVLRHPDTSRTILLAQGVRDSNELIFLRHRYTAILGHESTESSIAHFNSDKNQRTNSFNHYFLRLMGAIFLVPTTCLLIISVYSFSWPTASGTMIDSRLQTFDVHSRGGRVSNRWYPDVIYTYKVDNQAYESSTLSFIDYKEWWRVIAYLMPNTAFFSEAEARSTISHYANISAVKVRYLPYMPTISTLESWPNRSYLFWLSCSSSLIFGGIMILIDLILTYKNRFKTVCNPFKI